MNVVISDDAVTKLFLILKIV